MKFRNGSQLLQPHSGWLMIFELWFKGDRCVSFSFHPLHIFHLRCGTNGAVKGEDYCLDVNVHALGFFFSYTDFGYGRYRRKQ